MAIAASPNPSRARPMPRFPRCRPRPSMQRAAPRHEPMHAACRARVKAVGGGGFAEAVVPAEHGGLHRALDVRTLCLARDILAFRDGLSDFAFAMQGLGTASISLFGSAALK